MPTLQPLSKTSHQRRGPVPEEEIHRITQNPGSTSKRHGDPVATAAGATALGLRGANEDHFTAIPLVTSENGSLGASTAANVARNWLVAVADGMGGGQSGAHASRRAVEVFTENVQSKFPCRDNGAMSSLTLQHFGAEAREACQRALAEETMEARHGTLSGTTLTSGVITFPFLYLFHVGDSRCYLKRGSHLKQLTDDHSLYAEMIRAGSPADGVAGDNTRSTQPEAQFDTSVVRLERGDVLVFCTDGVTGTLSDETILALLVEHDRDSAEHVANALVTSASSQGGGDNATAVVVKL
jgi:PPM family protein phosphatase